MSNPNPNFNFNINTNPTGSPTLGSVTHKFRKKNFKAALVQARWILIIAGCFGLAQAFLTYYLSMRQMDREVGDLAAAGVSPSVIEMARQQGMSLLKMIVGAQAAIGVIFIACGFGLSLAPLPITIGCLAIYLGFHAVLALINPVTIFMGWIFKAIFIAALAIAIRSTALYRNDLRQAEFELASRGGTMPLR